MQYDQYFIEEQCDSCLFTNKKYTKSKLHTLFQIIDHFNLDVLCTYNLAKEVLEK